MMCLSLITLNLNVLLLLLVCEGCNKKLELEIKQRLWAAEQECTLSPIPVKNKPEEQSSVYEEISICPLARLWRLKRPAWLLPVVASLPAEVGTVGTWGASWSHSAVIGSIEHSIEHLAVRHYALHLKCYYFTYSAVTPTQGTVD